MTGKTLAVSISTYLSVHSTVGIGTFSVWIGCWTSLGLIPQSLLINMYLILLN